MADPADVQLPKEASAHRDPSPKQPHGALVAHALLDAARFSKVSFRTGSIVASTVAATVVATVDVIVLLLLLL